jgi:purine-binding chemotaxis protein CheW
MAFLLPIVPCWDAYILTYVFMTGASATQKKPAAANRVLTFALRNERYAINVMSVRKIIRPIDISPVPLAPRELLGVINWRGKIVPVVDLRIKFGFEATPPTDRTCIVIVERSDRAGAQNLTGLLVDEVQEVITLNVADVEDAPSFGGAVDAAYIRGLAKTKGAVTILLDLEQMFGESTREHAQ